MSILPDWNHLAPLTEYQKARNKIVIAEMELASIRRHIEEITARIAKRRKGIPTPKDKWQLNDAQRDERSYVSHIEHLNWELERTPKVDRDLW